eukprot:TRINITY_DN7270_c0_g1_i1.p1 TRINITY_DN7270_c0_g1~~TRINITY_DN7270_c0_g1_i1.p1  ORF type:complete len:538 (-),score=97.96 TRINITY_DN7270_c0_g1_i1:99-1712(-)
MCNHAAWQVRCVCNAALFISAVIVAWSVSGCSLVAHEEENPLETNPAPVVALGCVALFALFPFAAHVGRHYLHRLWPAVWFEVNGRPQLWVIAVLFASYAVLVPGIYSTMFSFNMFLHLDLQIAGVEPVDYNLTRKPLTECLATFVELLRKSGEPLGAFLIVLHAAVFPLLKLALLICGEVLRGGRYPETSSRCIATVQSVSKWAAPDIFVYVLLLYLFRALDTPSYQTFAVHTGSFVKTEIKSKAALDLGFLCFSMFCISSTATAVSIQQPDISMANAKDIPSRRRSQHVAAGAITLALVCVVLVVHGFFLPCMGLIVDRAALEKPLGPVPKDFMGLVDDIKLLEKLRTETSLIDCLQALAWWTISLGEVTSLVAFLLIGVFAGILPLLDVGLLAWAAYCIALEWPGAERALLMSCTVRKLSMLDVLCMGVIVVCFAGEAFKAFGFGIGLRQGMAHLVGAEVIHQGLFHIVSYIAPLGKDEENLIESGLYGDKSEFLESCAPLAASSRSSKVDSEKSQEQLQECLQEESGAAEFVE